MACFWYNIVDIEMPEYFTPKGSSGRRSVPHLVPPVSVLNPWVLVVQISPIMSGHTWMLQSCEDALQDRIALILDVVSSLVFAALVYFCAMWECVGRIMFEEEVKC